MTGKPNNGMIISQVPTNNTFNFIFVFRENFLLINKINAFQTLVVTPFAEGEGAEKYLLTYGKMSEVDSVITMGHLFWQRRSCKLIKSVDKN